MPLLSNPILGQKYWFRTFRDGKCYIFSGVFTGITDVKTLRVGLQLVDGTMEYVPKEMLYTSKESARHGLRRYQVVH